LCLIAQPSQSIFLELDFDSSQRQAIRAQHVMAGIAFRVAIEKE
jgi:hypothetical protein